MKLYYEKSLVNFKGWSGAQDTLDELTFGELEQLENILNYKDWNETELNDLLRFEKDHIANWLGYLDWGALLEAHKKSVKKVLDK